MLENVKYHLGREYEFYATISQGQRSKGGAAVIIKNSTHNTKHNPPGSSSRSLNVREKKKKSSPNNIKDEAYEEQIGCNFRKKAELQQKCRAKTQ